MQAIVVRLSDLTFLSSEDLSGACSQAELGEKIIKQFAFLTGDIRVTITDGTARIEYRQPATEKISEAQRLSEQASQKAKMSKPTGTGRNSKSPSIRLAG
jgi:hypothetical protein